jgi:hypothetical protein
MFWGLSVAAWEAIGTWVSGIATLAAVIAALYIARRDNAVRLKLFATVGQIAGNPNIPLERKHLWISVTNVGYRAVKLNTIGWRSGLFHFKSPWLGRKYAVINVGQPYGPNPPVKLEHGDAVNWMIPLDEWLRDSPHKIVAKPYWLGLMTSRIQAFTSTGETVNSKVNPGLLEKIEARLTNRDLIGAGSGN